MNEAVSGDIFPAVQAIEMIDRIDIAPPLEVPPVPPEAEPANVPADEHRELIQEITRLKKERNAYILAHNYAPADIQDVADAVGDSLYLAQQGARSTADILLEASVLFMNQILAIMKKPDQKVLAPDLGALCSLAAHADVGKIRAWKRAHPTGIVVSYVNTYLDVKAESDLLLRLGERCQSHSACSGAFRSRAADSLFARCLSRFLRRQAARTAE